MFPLFVPIADKGSSIHMKMYSLCSETCENSFSDFLTNTPSLELETMPIATSVALPSQSSVTFRSKAANIKNTMSKPKPHWLEITLHAIIALYYGWLLRSMIQTSTIGAHSALDIFAWILIVRGIASWIILFRDISLTLEVSTGTIQLFSRYAVRWGAASIPIQFFSSICILLIVNQADVGYFPSFSPVSPNSIPSSSYLSILASPDELYATSDLSKEIYYDSLDTLPLSPVFLFGYIPFLFSILETFTAAPSNSAQAGSPSSLSPITASSVSKYELSLISQIIAAISVPLIYCVFSCLIYNLTKTLPYPSMALSVESNIDFFFISLGVIVASLGIFAVSYLLKMFVVQLKVALNPSVESVPSILGTSSSEKKHSRLQTHKK